MVFNRFDIMLAYYLFSVYCHGGQFTKEYAYQGRLARIGYNPSNSEQFLSCLEKEENEGAKLIYQNLCQKAGTDTTI